MSTGAETTAISSGETIRPAREEEVDVSTLPTAAVDEHGELVPGAILGTGGMAVVHSATQTALRRDVALKRAIAGDKESIAALVREARILGALEHPNIPPVHLLATDATGTPVLAMKRIDGAAWSELLTVAHQDPLDRTLEILEAVCRALQFAHERGIIHRDVKPANVMLGSHGEIYLVDWGIALTRGEACSRPTLAGTPAYMAPEMAVLGPITPQTDVYLVGATLYRVLTRSPPHAAPSASEALERAQTNAIEPIAEEGIPRELATACMRALATDPAARFASAEELRSVLASCRKRLATAGLVTASRARTATLGAMAKEGALPTERRDEARALYREASFGFDQALQIVNDDERVRSGRDEAAIAMAWIEVNGGDERAALSLLEAVSQIPAGLASAIETLVQKRKSEAQEVAHLRVVVRQHDASVGSAARTAATVSLVAFWGVFSVVLGWLRMHGKGSTNFSLSVIVPLAFCTTVICAAIALRGIIRRTVVNRQFFAGLIVSGGWLLFSRCYFVYVLHVPVERAIVNDLGGLALVACVLAFTIDSRLFVAAGAFLLCAIATIAWPLASPFTLTLGTVVFAITATRIWRRPREDSR